MAETTFKNTTVELNDTGFSKYAALAADAVCDIKSRVGKKRAVFKLDRIFTRKSTEKPRYTF